MASGCQSCDGKAIYATITRTYFNQTGANFDDVAIEGGNCTMAVNDKKQMTAYAVFTDAEPHQMDNAKVTWAVASAGTQYLSFSQTVPGLLICTNAIQTPVQVSASVTIDGVTKTDAISVSAAQ